MGQQDFFFFNDRATTEISTGMMFRTNLAETEGMLFVFSEPFRAQVGGRHAIEAYQREKVPLGRWATIDEIAECILFLVYDRSAYVTGQILVADGGETVV